MESDNHGDALTCDLSSEESNSHLANSDETTRKSDEQEQEQEQEREAEHSHLTPIHWSHRRRESYASIADNRPAAITLEDHTEGPDVDYDAVWARAIYIQDYVIVSGNLPSVGSFVVWHCGIETLDGTTMVIRKRYSEFFELRKRLLLTFPNSGGAMPPFPRKTLIHRFQPAFLETRRVGLGYWLTCVLLNPEFCSSPVTKEFIFG